MDCIFLAFAIKCWRCSSDAANSQEFCGNPFDSNILSDKSDYYGKCPEPHGHSNPRSPSSNQRAVCLKSTQTGEFCLFFGLVPNNLVLHILKRFPWIFSCIQKVSQFVEFLSSLNFLTLSVRGKFIVVRRCHIEDVDSSKNACINNAITEGKVEFCETCSTDGCNGATQFAPGSLLLIFPVVVVKLLLF